MSVREKSKAIDSICYYVFLAIYFGVLVYLFYNQLQYPVTGLFESDTAVHVRFAVEEHYFHSLAAFIYCFFSIFPFADGLTAICLSLVTVLAIDATRVLFRKLCVLMGINVQRTWTYIFAVLLNFTMGFYLKAANRQHYIGYQNANMWHNSTYIFMRLFAILTLILFIDIYGKYKESFSFKDWLSFSLLLAVTSGFKASFLTVFAPAFAIILLVDLIKGAKFKRVFFFGTTVFPGIIVMIAQSIVMSGDGASNGYVISPFTALSMRGDHPKVTLILSVLFPLAVLAFHLFDFYKDRVYFITLIMWAIAFLEVFLLAETGERSLDSNFFWGYSIALFFLFLVSLLKCIRDFESKKYSKLSLPVFAVLMAVFFWHVLSGMWYLGLLLTGVTYFV